MYTAARTWARPPQTVRVPRRVPLSRGKGATPTRAARRWRLKVPHCCRSSRKVRDHTGPLPGPLRNSTSRPTGMARRVVSSSSSRVTTRVSSQVLCACLSARRRWDTPRRRFCSAVRIAMSWRRPDSWLARPCQIRAAGPRTTGRALKGVDATTQATLRSRRTTAESVYHVRVRVTRILSHHP